MTEKKSDTPETCRPVDDPDFTLKDALEQNFQPVIFQHVMISLLKNKKCFTPAYLDTIKSVYDKAEESRQDIIQKQTKAGTPPPELACKKGCSYCCGLTVKVAIPELYIIFEYLQETKTEAELEQIIYDLDQYTQRMEASKTRNEKLQVSCAFLKEGACSIYEVRPLPCHAWNSTRVDSCIDFMTDQTIDIPSSFCHYGPYDTVKKAIMKSLYILGYDEATEELNSGLLRMLRWEQEVV